MKNASVQTLEVNSTLSAAAKSVLQEGETLAGFVEEAVRLNIAHREAQRDFLARGMLAREEAKQSGQYVSSDEMLNRLDMSLATARAKQAVHNR